MRTRINPYQYLEDPPFINYIESGCLWTPDAAGSTLLGSMTAGVVWIGGKRLTVAAVSHHTFGASVDTCVDFQDNGDGTANVNYNTSANNAASAALANSGTTANTIRNAIVVSGASNIAAQASINQGSVLATLPTTTNSVPLAVCDTIGNLIYPKPNQKLLGLRMYPAGSGPSSTSTSLVAMSAGLNIPVLVANIPGGAGNIKASMTSRSASGAAGGWEVGLCLASASAANLIPGADYAPGTTNLPMYVSGVTTLSANNTVVPAFSTTSGTVAVQAFNNSLIHFVELD